MWFVVFIVITKVVTIIVIIIKTIDGVQCALVVIIYFGDVLLILCMFLYHHVKKDLKRSFYTLNLEEKKRKMVTW